MSGGPSKTQTRTHSPRRNPLPATSVPEVRSVTLTGGQAESLLSWASNRPRTRDRGRFNPYEHRKTTLRCRFHSSSGSPASATVADFPPQWCPQGATRLSDHRMWTCLRPGRRRQRQLRGPGVRHAWGDRSRPRARQGWRACRPAAVAAKGLTPGETHTRQRAMRSCCGHPAPSSETRSICLEHWPRRLGTVGLREREYSRAPRRSRCNGPSPKPQRCLKFRQLPGAR